MFKSTHHALQFVFSTLGTPIVKLSSINSMRGGGSYGELTPHDRHAQAAMILAIVEKVVDVNGLAYLHAQYGRELKGGERKRQVEDILIRVVMGALPTGMHSRKGVGKLVLIYFGQDISMVSVRKDMQCGHAKANEYRDAVHKALGSVGERAEREIDMALRQSGLIFAEEMVA